VVLTLNTEWEGVFGFTRLGPLYPRYPFIKRLGELQKSGRFGKAINYLPQLAIEARLIRM